MTIIRGVTSIKTVKRVKIFQVKQVTHCNFETKLVV